MVNLSTRFFTDQLKQLNPSSITNNGQDQLEFIPGFQVLYFFDDNIEVNIHRNGSRVPVHKYTILK